MTITTKAPYEHIPGFPSPSPPTPTNSIAMATNQPRPLSSIASGQSAHSEVFDMSLSTDATVQLSRTWSEPNAKKPAANLPGKEARLSQISERIDKRRLSKKEKKFQLSKDDGSYSELKPINPHEAKKEFGDTLKLNPVGPAFQSAAAAVQAGAENGEELSSGDDHVTTAHNVVEREGKNKAQFQGSYYVLEVGNFDPIEDPPVVSPPTSGNSLTTPTQLQAGYYMLDVHNFDDDDYSTNVAMTTETKRASSAVAYENITPSSATPTHSSKVSSPEARLSRSPENRLVAEATYGPIPPTTNQEGATVYENVIITALGVPEPIVPVEHPYNVPPPTANLHPLGGGEGGEPQRPLRADGRGFWAGPIEDESGYTLVNEHSRKKLGPGGIIVNARLPDCYEQCKVDENQTDQQPSSSTGPTPSTNDHVTQSPKKSTARKREEVYEAIKVGGANNISRSQPSSIPHTHVNGTNGRSEREMVQSSSSLRENGGTLDGTSIIDNPQDNPFAGLVLSASRQLEESLPRSMISPSPLGEMVKERERIGGGGGGDEGFGRFRGRADTVWDDVRMEKEWTQIDTLLRDMSLPEGPEQSSLSTSPVKQTGDIYQWLKGHQLSGCTSALESSGFDSKEFLNGGILAMDDLVDIGITDDGDRYNLMAAVSLLPDPPTVGHAHSVSEWLQMLSLSQLERKFQGYTLKRVSNFWDIELSSVVGIELLGYRKRLQYGIGQLRRVHPEWVGQTIPSQITNAKPPAVPKIPAKKRKATPTAVGPTHAQLLREDESELSVRPPSATMGSNSRKVSSSSSSWKHPNSALTDGCNYHIKYLGSLIVRRLHGQQSAEEACLKLRHTQEKMMRIPEIILSISWKGVQFADASSKSVVSTHAIRDISYCSADIEDKTVFAYITRDRKANVNYSHVFMAPSQAIAEEIRLTIGQAFEICYQKVMKAKRLSQEKRTSGGSPMTSPVH